MTARKMLKMMMLWMVLLATCLWLLRQVPRQQWHTLVEKQGQGAGLVGMIADQRGPVRLQWQCQQTAAIGLILDSVSGKSMRYHEPCEKHGGSLVVQMPGSVYIGAMSDGAWTVPTGCATSFISSAAWLESILPDLSSL